MTEHILTMGRLIGVDSEDLIFSPVPFRSTPFVRYKGSAVCSWIHKTHRELLDWAMLHVALKYPDRKDRTLYAGDASSLGGILCPNHERIHGIYTQRDAGALDLHYLTHETNLTDFRSKADPRTIIWDGNKLNENFDIPRNRELLTIIKDCVPDASIFVDSRIYDALELPFLLQDSDPAHRHNLHVHISWGFAINPNGVICVFRRAT